MRDIIVVDNFYKDPERVRDLAIRAEYLREETLPQDYPGTETRKGYFSQSILGKFEKLLQTKIDVNPRKHAFGVFSKPTEKSDALPPQVHTDGSAWTGIVYLNDYFDVSGGTELVEHKESGLRRLPNAQQLQRLGLPSVEEFVKQVLHRDQFNQNSWSVHFSTAYKFNRLLLFKSGSLFHRSAKGRISSKSLNNLRLTQLFFFDTLLVESSQKDFQCLG